MLLAITENEVYLATDSPKRFVKRQLNADMDGREFHFIPYDPEIFEEHMSYLRNQVSQQGLLEGIIRRAVILGVSDIHLVAKNDSFAVMYRYLGVRALEHHLSKQQGEYIIAQAKDLAKMDIAERRLPQDGGFRTKVVDRSVDFRVATVPVINGESIVIRVLDAERVNPNLTSLGMARNSMAEWRKAISYTSGICLVCGPTGSGKSTTMNASVREMDRFGRSIYTVKDPVELRLAFLNQVESNRSTGLDFKRALRAFLRADPDIIVVGEIRDIETAELAINAAETGHLVLATLHTDSPLGAILRLQSLGLDTPKFASHLRGVMAQQLVRTVCPTCEGDGCDQCNNTGFSGRTMISEAVHLSGFESVKDVSNGKVWWPTTSDDGRRLVESEITTATEVSRVLGQKAQIHSLISAGLCRLPFINESDLSFLGDTIIIYLSIQRWFR
jgi:general secretion pathway protein E